MSSAVALPNDKKLRKEAPMARGALDYFPHALLYVARVSFVGNEQHNPGEPMHWAKEKSTDHADCVMRHLAERGGFDTDIVGGKEVRLRHSGKLAWRALANLQIELEEAAKAAGVSVADLLNRELAEVSRDTTDVRGYAKRHVQSSGIFEPGSGQGTKDTSPTPIMGAE